MVGGELCHLLPQIEGPLVCPFSPERAYRGVTRLENLNRHVKDHHPHITSTTYRCRLCGFMAPADKRYPRKTVSTHVSTAHPENAAPRTGAADGARRRAIRNRIESAPPAVPAVRPPPPAPAVAIPAEPRDPHPVERMPEGGNSQSPVRPERAPVSTPHEHTLDGGDELHPPVASGSEDDEVFATPVARRRPRPRRANAIRSGSSSASTPPTQTPPQAQNTSAAAGSPLAAPPPPPPPPERRRPPGAVRELVDALNNTQDRDHLEGILPRVMEYLGKHRRPRDRPETRQQRRRPPPPHAQVPFDRVQAAKQIQSLYRKSKKRAVQQVLEGQQKTCEIPPETVYEHFARQAACRDGEAEWPQVFDRAEPSAASNETLCAAFTRDEVVRRLRYRANTAPGPDGITYSDLKKADPSAHILAALFNAIMRTEHFPPPRGRSR